VDDQPKNLQLFEGQGLLYSAPHNLTATGFVRVNNWREVAEYFAA
jgi:5'-nucleotidase